MLTAPLHKQDSLSSTSHFIIGYFEKNDIALGFCIFGKLTI